MAATPTPEHIKFTAEAFFRAYEHLDAEMDVAPAKVACLAFANELALKALLALEGLDHRREHSIFALFQRLSPGTQTALLELVPTQPDEFLRKLSEEQTSDAFVLWRYIHELPEGSTGNTWTGCLNQLYAAAVQIFERLAPGR